MDNFPQDLEKITGGFLRYASEKEKINFSRRRYIYELAEIICERSADEADIGGELHKAYVEALESSNIGLTNTEAAQLSCFCAEMLRDRIAKMGYSVFGVVESQKPTTICYVKNAFSDMAYRAFDIAIGGLFSEYADGFMSAAQAVYYENSSGCILPFMAEDGTYMSGIAKLVEKYDLKKSAVYTVEKTKYAVFTHGIWKNDQADTMEFAVRTPDTFSTGDIINAARQMGFYLALHNTRISSDDGERYEHFILKTRKQGNFDAMLVYLSFEFERNNLMGIYKETE